MKRSIDQIQAAIIKAFVTSMNALGVVVDPSRWGAKNKQKTAIATFAKGTQDLEGIIEGKINLIESKISIASPQSAGWFQNMLLNVFQFSEEDPQIVQLRPDTFAPYYSEVNEDLRIIKYCSVVSAEFGAVTVKVAKQIDNAPAKLSDNELSAASSFVKQIGIDGISYSTVSANSDKIFIDASVFGRGEYSVVLKDNVIAAIQTYLSNIPFNGYVVISDMEIAIKAVAGVNDVVFNNVRARTDATPFGAGTTLVSTGTLILRKYQSGAGYIVGETTTGYTLADKINVEFE